MLYLAQVQKREFLGQTGLRLLARQRAEHAWSLTVEPETLPAAGLENLAEGLLVLIELSASREVLSVTDAKDWILSVVEKFLVNGITPSFLQQETERAEQWRQSLTLQSQELSRRSLELEARREQIQMLEDSLKREKKLELDLLFGTIRTIRDLQAEASIEPSTKVDVVLQSESDRERNILSQGENYIKDLAEVATLTITATEPVDSQMLMGVFGTVQVWISLPG